MCGPRCVVPLLRGALVAVAVDEVAADCAIFTSRAVLCVLNLNKSKISK